MAGLVGRYVLISLAVLILNFVLPRILPGDPFDQTASDGQSAANSPLPSAVRARLLAQYRLDRPITAQFTGYVSDLSRGDLGTSISRSTPVSQIVADRLPWTLGLVLTATIIAGVGGVLLGLLAGWRGGRLDSLVVGSASLLAALPEFLVAIGLLIMLSVGLGWFPISGGRTAFASADPIASVADLAWHLTLPGLTLVIATLAAYVLLTRGAVLPVRSEPYLVTARAKGLGELAIAFRHALPNAILPILTLFGLRIGQVLGGAIVVERVFAVPGLGLLAFEAIRDRDYPVIQAVFLISSFGVLAANFVIELLYRRLEPRR